MIDVLQAAVLSGVAEGKVEFGDNYAPKAGHRISNDTGPAAVCQLMSSALVGDASHFPAEKSTTSSAAHGSFRIAAHASASDGSLSA